MISKTNFFKLLEGRRCESVKEYLLHSRPSQFNPAQEKILTHIYGAISYVGYSFFILVYLTLAYLTSIY